jgi:hypothetical protein
MDHQLAKIKDLNLRLKDRQKLRYLSLHFREREMTS